MFSQIPTSKSTADCSADAERIGEALISADAVVIGAGSGLSASAGFTYSGARFMEYFADFHEKYGIADMYSGGFYPYATPEEYWAWWSRHIYYNRYVPAPKPVYDDLCKLVSGRDYFVLTTNVDHCFQKAGFDKSRLFYTQGDYGLWQCGKPCHRKTYDNEEPVRRMLAEQKDMRIPTALIPRCPVCGGPMTMNLRSDDRFVEDDGWRSAAGRYAAFINAHRRGRTVYLELGVGGNTPGIIKYPFRQMTAQNPLALYICVNQNEAVAPKELEGRAVCADCDVGGLIRRLTESDRLRQGL